MLSSRSLDVKPNLVDSRSQAIDLLRVLAIAIVVSNHFGSPFSGVYGVALFFCVSGFCIGGSLNRSSKLFDFFVKRFVRLTPCLIACGLATVAFEFVFADKDLYLRDTSNLENAANFVCLPFANLFCDGLYLFWKGRPISYDWIDGVYWSLLVEMRFYILFGVIWVWLKNFKVAIYVLCGLSLIALFDLSGKQILSKQDDFFFHLPFFAIGLIMALHKNWAQRVVPLLLCLCLLIVFSAMNVGSFSYRHSFSSLPIFIIISSLIILPIVVSRSSTKFTGLLGNLTYPVYLLHQDIGIVIDHRILGRDIVTADVLNFELVLLKLSVVLLLALVIHGFFELPCQRTMKRWLHKPAI